MNPRLSLTATLVVALAAASTDSRFVGTGTQMSPSDSAMAEFEAGRFWHAARMMRDEGAATGEAADVWLLARAEAGWNNWPAVERLLADAD